jgi:hypothetical protein
MLTSKSRHQESLGTGPHYLLSNAILPYISGNNKLISFLYIPVRKKYNIYKYHLMTMHSLFFFQIGLLYREYPRIERNKVVPEPHYSIKKYSCQYA